MRSLRAVAYGSDTEFFAAGDRALESARQLLAKATPQSFLSMMCSCWRPYSSQERSCVGGLNYREHAIESQMEIFVAPAIFLKLPNAMIGPNQNIVSPRKSTQPNYEAELAAGIGKHGKNIPPEDWMHYVVGYTILNNINARDVQLATSHWVLGKSFDPFTPMGPAIVTADQVSDLHALDIQLSIDGEVLQHSNTNTLSLSFRRLSRISRPSCQWSQTM